jgi:hypothetical protein
MHFVVVVCKENVTFVISNKTIINTIIATEVTAHHHRLVMMMDVPMIIMRMTTIEPAHTIIIPPDMYTVL